METEIFWAAKLGDSQASWDIIGRGCVLGTQRWAQVCHTPPLDTKGLLNSHLLLFLGSSFRKLGGNRAGRGSGPYP